MQIVMFVLLSFGEEGRCVFGGVLILLYAWDDFEVWRFL